MTATALAARRWVPTARARLILLGLTGLGWAVSDAGIGDGIVNDNGISTFGRFWAAARDPELGWTFVTLTLDAAAVTLSFAVLGTLLSLLIGVAGAVLLSELVTGRTWTWRATRLLLVGPRSIHEILWALLLIQIFGFDPVVAVLAIGVPFGAVTAKVFAETIDEADPGPYRLLRASGTGRIAGLAYGVVPAIRDDLVSYSFYRLECAIRSAAVLGVIGAGGLGFQLALSFESLRYGEIWTLIAALMVLSGLADWWSSTVRSKTGGRTAAISVAVLVALVPVSWRWADLSLTGLWSSRTRSLAIDVLGRLLPPRLGPGGWSELIDATVATLAMSILATTFAAGGGLLVAPFVARRTRQISHRSFATVSVRFLVRLILLLMRAVPAPVWAFLFVLILFPGTWPGAVALGVYNMGVLGRLYGEALEARDTTPADTLTLTGASTTQAFFYGTLPATWPRLVSLTLYRWEVIARETVVVGVVGAGGLGQLINEHLAARDFAAISGAIAMLIVATGTIDAARSRLRSVLR